MRTPALIVLLLVLWLGSGRACAEPVAVPLRIVDATLLESDSAQPPADDAAWQAVRLGEPSPDRVAMAGYTWLRMELAEAPPGAEAGTLALYMPALRRALAVFVNGREVAAQRAPAMNRRVLCCPVYVELPADAFRGSGPHRLDLRLTSIPGRYVVWNPVYVGDAAVLWARHEARIVAAGAGPLVALLFAVVASAVCLGLWLRRRTERLLLIFGLCAVMYVVAAGLGHWIAMGEWSLLARVVGGTADFASVALMLIFLLRHAGWRWRRAETALWTWVAVSAGIQVFDDFYDWLSPWHAWWYTGIALDMASVPLAVAIAWRRGDLWSVLLVAGAAFSSVLVGWQVIGQHTDAEALYLWPYHQLLLYAVIAAMLMDRLVRALRDSERLNADLERRVEARGRALQVQHEQLRDLERDQAVAAERKRLMSDMHDGIGAALISTLALVEQGRAAPEEVAAALRECVDDLRLAIDSLEPADGELAPVLGALRYRLEPRLEAAGIALDWQVGDLPALPGLTPSAVLHILRLVQEAFTNVIKHARARRIAVRVGVEDDGRCVAIRVQDDGTGFSGVRPAGNGLRNMERRAAAVGGALAVHASRAGTTVELRLPLQASGLQPA